MINNRDEKDMTVIKEYVTWNDIEDYIERLGSLIKNNHFTGVYGPARGGLVFAVMISHRYDLPFLGAPCKGCLIVDDIVDTGKTAQTWQEKGYIVTSMYYKQNSLVTPDFWFKEKGDKWIVFPYEKIDE